MKCEQAQLLIDEYLEQALNPGDRRHLEVHLASCVGCAEEFRRRASFERALRQGLGVSVQHRALSAQASTEMIHAAQGTLRHAIRSNRVRSGARAAGAVAALALVLVGLSYLLTRLPLALQLRPLALEPVRQWFLARQRPVATLPLEEVEAGESMAATPTNDMPVLSMMFGDTSIEPELTKPGAQFVLTILFVNNVAEPVKDARFDLEISGPTGDFRFPLAVKGSLRANGVASVHVTDEVLSGPCKEKYLTPATDIFRSPGVYSLRLTLYNPVVTPSP